MDTNYPTGDTTIAQCRHLPFTCLRVNGTESKFDTLDGALKIIDLQI